MPCLHKYTLFFLFLYIYAEYEEVKDTYIPTDSSSLDAQPIKFSSHLNKLCRAR